MADPSVPPSELPDAHRYIPLELQVAGLISTFPPYDQEHPQLRLPMARAVVRLVTEYEPDDAEVARSEPDANEPNDLLYDAWTVIANASEWIERDPDGEWVQAAVRWRDRWHSTLDAKEVERG